MLTDTHVHLNRHEFAGDLPQVIARARQAGVARFLNVGYDLESSQSCVALATADARIAAAVGIHPHDASLLADDRGQLTAEGRQRLAQLEELAGAPRVVAIGEIGLDFYRDLSPRPAQRTALSVQLALAQRIGLPVIFHIRDAYAETLALIESVGIPERRGVLHAFSGGPGEARWAREHGLRLGIGGPLTYKNSPLPAALGGCTAADVLLETDAPWLPPVPHRGQRNEPAFLPVVCAKLADLFGLSRDDLEARIEVNCEDLFGRF